MPIDRHHRNAIIEKKTKNCFLASACKKWQNHVHRIPQGMQDKYCDVLNLSLFIYIIQYTYLQSTYIHTFTYFYKVQPQSHAPIIELLEGYDISHNENLIKFI